MDKTLLLQMLACVLSGVNAVLQISMYFHDKYQSQDENPHFLPGMIWSIIFVAYLVQICMSTGK
mgnify:CR=1 FL=1